MFLCRTQEMEEHGSDWVLNRVISKRLQHCLEVRTLNYPNGLKIKRRSK
jgi:hypothetical protein